MFIDPAFFIRFGFVPQVEVYRVQSDDGIFRITEKPQIVTVDLENPEVIYSEDFISEVSYWMLRGKTLEVNCGKKNTASNLVAKELTSKDLLDKVNYVCASEIEIRKIRKGLFKKEDYVYVIFKKLKDKNEEARSDQEPLNEYLSNLEDDSDSNQGSTAILDTSDDIEFIPDENNKYSTAAAFEITDGMSTIERGFKTFKIVQVKKTGIPWEPQSFGVFLEMGRNNSEIIVNLAGQNEEDLKDVFTEPVIYFLKKGYKVLIDFNLHNSGHGEYSELASRITESEAYDFIKAKTGAEIEIQEKSLNPNISDEKLFVVLERWG